ncbi:HD domain-containing protein [Bordetella bronchialis]|uniref:Hydrolase n=1 Tax=Bordetella bronchialis TaxID=463025 RepID=A0A193FU26_9BORD|nr:HD domain-containing protein [Bordetella bronchialis]ANN70686.1 hydrolase [Bordetella bronchialis]
MEEDLLAYWKPRLIRIAAPTAADDGAHDLNHLERVWSVARRILEDHADADALVVLAACFLHDLVNLPKNHPDRSRASTLAAEQASAALARAGFPPEKLPGVAHAIQAHSFSAGIPPRTIEACIVQDADRMDALGAIGLARMFHVGGQLGRPLAHGSDPLARERPLDDGQYALDHIEAKLLRLPETLHTAAARRIARARATRLRRFRDEFVAEWLGADGDN